MNVKIGEDWRIEMWWGNILNGFEHGDASFFFSDVCVTTNYVWGDDYNPPWESL